MFTWTYTPKTNSFLTLWLLISEDFADAVITMETALPASNPAAEGQSILQTSSYRPQIDVLTLILHLMKNTSDVQMLLLILNTHQNQYF